MAHEAQSPSNRQFNLHLVLTPYHITKINCLGRNKLCFDYPIFWI